MVTTLMILMKVEVLINRIDLDLKGFDSRLVILEDIEKWAGASN